MTKGLERILADELVYTHGSGLVESKSQYIQALRSGHQKYASVQHGSLKTRTYGNTAVVTGEVRMTGSTKGEPFDSRLRMTHVWVKQGPHWRLVAHQTTRLP
ncbi:MAG: nuclear transport factor 2 family protein [Acidobacteria bacterium]|nr:nuclear transport factor 2 family protein [Acidobacteriota bacterium]